MTTERATQTERRTWCVAGLTAPAWLIALALPKCPLCVMALLTSIGMGATLSAGLASWLQELVLLWAAGGIALLALLLMLTFTQRRRAGCAGHDRASCGHT